MNIIVAVDGNGCIGANNNLVVNNSEDIKFFKEMTTGNAVIMGKNTFDSLGNKALPNRQNIVVSSSITKEYENVSVVRDVMEAISSVDDDKEIFFIGGGVIYKEAIKWCKKVYLSRFEKVKADHCDVYFPLSGLEEYKLVEVIEKKGFNIEVYERK